ncbi:MAG TPA: dephospho-CoA kinase [Solirubrobacteraceae bacterium]|jgi:dephospho-CoA kinase|nr:dephospho-CoA kinase [Solirubrobacteraceae bacterium]
MTSGGVPFVGLTGGMGAGKSTALAELERLGAAVLSTDAVVHELYEGDRRLRDAIAERWGEDVLAPGGAVDRAAVAERVFADAEDRDWLEGVLWPLVGERVAEWLAEVRARRPAPRAAVVEVPLLFEAEMEGVYDATVAIVADEQTRRERAASRGHVLEDARTERQLPQEEKARRATFAIRNDGSERELAAQLSAVLDTLGG